MSSSSSFCERNIWAFIQVLEYQPDLFSEQDRADLNDLDKVLTKNLEQISDAIEKWQEFHPEILKAQNECLKELSDGKSETCRGQGGQPAPPPPSKAELRKQLTNAIRRNKLAATQPKPKPDEKSK